MQLYLYNISDVPTKINKTLGDAKVVNGVQKQSDTTVLNPIFVLSLDNFEYNYCYVPLFKRYYFINEITKQYNKFTKIDCKVDVLTTYKDSILLSSGILKRSLDYNKYIDNDYQTEVRKQLSKIEIPISFDSKGKYVMITGYSK